MRRIAITGHRELPTEVERSVEADIRAHIADMQNESEDGLVGLSCLADGADAIFAQTILNAGAALEVIVPAEQYRQGLPEQHRPVYDALLQQAALVHRLPFIQSTTQAHMEAGRHMVQRCDELLAVWDGKPARGPGGTADIVSYAHGQGRPVLVIWPPGAHR